ncbi:MAG: hypothetical protein IK006_05100 [Bacteroidaceae bacterium]|nr:hypothetical protein [Bacteroidaceae bacterium]
MTRFLPYKLFLFLLLPLMLVKLPAHSQEVAGDVILKKDTLRDSRIDSLYRSLNDSALWQQELEFVRNLTFDLPSDSAMFIEDAASTGRDRLTWREKDSIRVSMYQRSTPEWEPSPRKAVWMSLLVPGGGQIYNHKYWKLPIVYGGFMGCVYALTWNQSTYKDYQTAYVDIMDNDPTTKSYEDFLPPHYEIDNYTMDWLKDVFKKRKDKYRRYRDLSIFAFAGMYIISAIDAYVDAELSHFDISSDLSLRVEPGIFIDHRGTASSGFSLALCF